MPKILVLSFAAMMLLILTVPMASADLVIDAGLKKISPGGYVLIKGVRAQEDAGLSYQVEVTYGPRVDVLVMDKANYDSYTGGGAFTYLPMSQLDVEVTYHNSTVGELVPGSEYYVVVDNSDRPAGGAVPSGNEVQVSYGFSAGNVEVVEGGSGFGELFLIIGVVGVTAAVVVMVVVFLLIRRKKPAPVGPLPPGIKVCPNCGAQATMEYQYCPRCGGKV